MEIEFVRSRFIKHFDGKTGNVYASPGRINLIGEHTDYTGVIGAAILMPIMGVVVDMAEVIIAMCIMFVYYAYIFWFCNWGSYIGLGDRKLLAE